MENMGAQFSLSHGVVLPGRTLRAVRRGVGVSGRGLLVHLSLNAIS